MGSWNSTGILGQTNVGEICLTGQTCWNWCLFNSKLEAEVARQVLYTGLSDLFHPWLWNSSDMVKLVSALFQTNVRISQTNKNTLSEAWNKSEKHRTRQKAKIFGCLSYSIPISQTGISQKGNFWVSGLFQGQKVSGLFCTLRGKWVSGLFYGRISGLFCGLVWLSIVTLLRILFFTKVMSLSSLCITSMMKWTPYCYF